MYYPFELKVLIDDVVLEEAENMTHHH